MNSLKVRRLEEHQKYQRAYKRSSYNMGANRKKAAQKNIEELNVRGSFLDVACGRGEILEFAESIGFSPVVGVEVVDYLLGGPVVYGAAHNLPFEDKSFDVVTSFDAFEHFLPEDTESALFEIDRVSKKAVVLCIALTPSMNIKETLHINLRPVKEWDGLIRKFIEGEVECLPRTTPQSRTWVITKE